MLAKVESLCFSYGAKKVLNECSIVIENGEVVALVGLSGSGKTTLLRVLAGLETIQKGEISLLSPISYMPQHDLLLPWRTVWDNITLPLEIEGCSPDTAKIHQMLSEVGLEGCSHLYPSELSGGMKQRVAFVRTLMLKRPLLLLDEPFNAVDLLIRERLYMVLRHYLKQEGTSLLFVSHDYRDALAIADRLYILTEGILLPPLIISDSQRESPQALAQLTDLIRQILQGNILYPLEF